MNLNLFSQKSLTQGRLLRISLFLNIILHLIYKLHVKKAHTLPYSLVNVVMILKDTGQENNISYTSKREHAPFLNVKQHLAKERLMI